MPTSYYERLVQEDLDCGNSTTTKRNPGGGTLTATQVSLSTFARGQADVVATWAPGTIASQAQASTTITVPEATAGDKVLASLTTLTTAACIISAHVSAADTVTVVIANLSGAAVTINTDGDGATGTLSVLVFAHPLSTVPVGS
jgi:hypothetical protein